jgi:hypothetical protein
MPYNPRKRLAGSASALSREAIVVRNQGCRSIVPRRPLRGDCQYARVKSDSTGACTRSLPDLRHATAVYIFNCSNPNVVNGVVWSRRSSALEWKSRGLVFTIQTKQNRASLYNEAHPKPYTLCCLQAHQPDVTYTRYRSRRERFVAPAMRWSGCWRRYQGEGRQERAGFRYAHTISPRPCGPLRKVPSGGHSRRCV